MKSLRTEPEASTELEEAALWYEGKRAGLGLEFLDAVDVALEFVTRFTQAGPFVPFVPNDVPVRRVPVKRFPFHIVYLELLPRFESSHSLTIDVAQVIGFLEFEGLDAIGPTGQFRSESSASCRKT